MSKIKFYKKDVVKTPVNHSFERASESEKGMVLKGLKELPPKDQPVGLTLFYEYSDNFHHKVTVTAKPKIPKSLRGYFCPNLSPQQLDEKVAELFSISISSDGRIFIEHATRLQKTD